MFPDRHRGQRWRKISTIVEWFVAIGMRDHLSASRGVQHNPASTVDPVLSDFEKCPS